MAERFNRHLFILCLPDLWYLHRNYSSFCKMQKFDSTIQ
jgi:hypothetical protein